MPDICNKTGCDQPAKWTAKLNVPAKAIILNTEVEPAVTAILGLKLCDVHASMVHKSEFPNLEEQITKLVPGALLDMDGMWFSKVALDSEEYRAWEKPN